MSINIPGFPTCLRIQDKCYHISTTKLLSSVIQVCSLAKSFLFFNFLSRFSHFHSFSFHLMSSNYTTILQNFFISFTTSLTSSLSIASYITIRWKQLWPIHPVPAKETLNNFLSQMRCKITCPIKVFTVHIVICSRSSSSKSKSKMLQKLPLQG